MRKLNFNFKIFKIFNSLRTTYWQLLVHCPSIQINCVPIFLIWQFLILIIIFLIFFIAFAHLLRKWHIHPLIPFSTINNKLLTALILGLKQIFLDLFHELLNPFFVMFSTIGIGIGMYAFEIQTMTFTKMFYFKIFISNSLCMHVICICNIIHKSLFLRNDISLNFYNSSIYTSFLNNKTINIRKLKCIPQSFLKFFSNLV